jgi:hypothetical protein
MRVGLEPTHITVPAPEAGALTARPSHLEAYSDYCGRKIYIPLHCHLESTQFEAKIWC